MATASKNTPAISAEVNDTQLILTFSNGKELRLSANELSSDIRTAAMMHGLKQKLVDAAAIARNPDNGQSATIEDKVNAVCEVFERITSPDGTWNKVRGDGTGPVKGGMLLRALIAIFGKTEEETRALLDSCSDDEVKALRDSPKVQAKIAEFKRANSKIDVDALLASKFGA